MHILLQVFYMVIFNVISKFTFCVLYLLMGSSIQPIFIKCLLCSRYNSKYCHMSLNQTDKIPHPMEFTFYCSRERYKQ